LYYAILALTLILIPATTYVPAIHLTLAQGYFFDLRYTGIRTAWSLTVEETFYLIAPLVYLTIARMRAGSAWQGKPTALIVALALIVWILGLMMAGFGLSALFRGILKPYRLYGFMAMSWDNMRYLTVFGRFFEFAVGIGCAFVFKFGWSWRWPNEKYRPLLADCLSIVAIGGIALMCYLMNQAGGIYDRGWIYNYPVAILTGVWILALTNKDSAIARLMSAGVLVYLGRISYALYLLQVPVATMVIGSLLRRRDPLFMVELIVLLNVASALAYELVEKPGRRLVIKAADYLKSLFARRKEIVSGAE
jgi:peptidoglycan/LPS O-acetylase OafA/YrhL